MTVPTDHPDSPEAKRYADALRGAREGSPHALDDVIAELSPMLWRVARACGLDRQLAEDVVQTTWLALIKSVSTIEKPAALPGWLASTAKRESWKVGRGQKRENAVDQEWDGLIADQLDLDEDVADRMGLAPRYNLLWRSIGQLSDVCRALIQVIAYMDRPNYDQLATALGIPRGSIGPKRGRCLAELRKRLHSDPEWKY
ncbi:RNA polymerase sigma factor [Stackebrandtia nassauensis]|uniref:RNA polymerase, sigma-24 subunit, ECF subfamily n=1 Tax=Stackebrandtia nassauensis (strain DSM 44728 / CIP 108903 / NRRL B-16338 / NBRC 102104 / LLR-40K-21) TaxID=446470 RepID=D3PWD0_STANL|nr:sigma-70 family RNA polymerase sigma factor [Stackebrandtia nassauensis]ADD41287.1 RNA polymerase, sigma-24 subunit, ECF subfamily [Stackebrandtia nassauensis DSM 44728]